jgi:hypothetical protein
MEARKQERERKGVRALISPSRFKGKSPKT